MFDFNKGAGFAFNGDFRITGTQFTFTIGDSNDGVGLADGALAGVNVAAVPLPAGMLLLGTALGGFSFARRRQNKKA